MPPTVTATQIQGYPAWLLHWEHSVNKDDVARAFRIITQALDASTEPLWIVVDLRSNPVFPLRETISSAFWGPFRHKNMREWLVVGSNSTAHLIGNTLANITGRANIRWFHEIADVFAHMDAVIVDNSR
jgi:hypothetical protein